MMRCKDCGAPLEDGVDARSGDDGGTYDVCPERYEPWPADEQHPHRGEVAP